VNFNISHVVSTQADFLFKLASSVDAELAVEILFRLHIIHMAADPDRKKTVETRLAAAFKTLVDKRFVTAGNNAVADQLLVARILFHITAALHFKIAE